MDAKKEICDYIDQKKQLLYDAADQIWETPETRFDLPQSVEVYYEILAKEGFTIEKGVAGMKDAFIATYGSGQPVIGILAEYDALENLSQVADEPAPNQLEKGGNGHGCGHNLLGIGDLAGALGIKAYMAKHDLKGTIKLFGCPAEESGYGKAFMARDGIFNGVDAALTWHPMDVTGAWGESSLAVYQIYYSFKGISAHAAQAPEEGCSALDAAELMNIGTQFLREHMIDEARVHYAFIDAGGEAANVVQPTAKLYYFIRAPKLEQAAAIYERVNKIAQGAALMTETELTIEFSSACANYRPNKAITTVLDQNIHAYGRIGLDDQDQAHAKRYYDGLSDDTKQNLVNRAKAAFPDYSVEQAKTLGEKPVFDDVMPLVFSDKTNASSDVGDVSWCVPTAQLTVACEPQGTSTHSWQWAANGKSSVGHKGMLAAGKSIATTAYDLLTQPELIAQAKVEHLAMMGGKVYQSVIPEDVKPK